MRASFTLLFLLACVLQCTLAAPVATYDWQGDVPFQIEQHPVYESSNFLALFRNHVGNNLGLPDVNIENLAERGPTPGQLAADFAASPKQRRFLYLGHTRPGRPDMVVAAPLSGLTQDGGKLFTILSVHKNHNGAPKIKSYGYSRVPNAYHLIQRFEHGSGASHQALEPGHVLTLPEMFDELALFRPPSWKP